MFKENIFFSKMNIFFSINDNIKCYFFERKKSYCQYYFLVTDFKEKIMFKMLKFWIYLKEIIFEILFFFYFWWKKMRTVFRKIISNGFVSLFNFENLSYLEFLFTSSHIMHTLVSRFGVFLIWYRYIIS